jgi:uncharacterized protein YeaO (DUF488 family)
MDVRAKRAYEPAAPSEDHRVLIDRIWPREVTREEAHVDEWARELAPGRKLRRWFGHYPGRFPDEFGQRNTEELAAQKRKLRELRSCAGEGTLRLVYGARDTEHNDAVALAEILRRRRRSR